MPFFKELLELYKKIKAGIATEDEKIEFEVGLNMRTISREFIIQKLEEALREQS